MLKFKYHLPCSLTKTKFNLYFQYKSFWKLFNPIPLFIVFFVSSKPWWIHEYILLLHFMKCNYVLFTVFREKIHVTLNLFQGLYKNGIINFVRCWNKFSMTDKLHLNIFNYFAAIRNDKQKRPLSRSKFLMGRVMAVTLNLLRLRYKFIFCIRRS